MMTISEGNYTAKIVDNGIQVNDLAGSYNNDLPNRLLKFATSMGANFEEAQATRYAEFRQRIKICLREARETI